jgi:predicted dehydrogenase
MTRVALVGCGFVADLYMPSLPLHPSLEVAGVFDNRPERLQAFSRFHRLRAYRSLEELLDDPSVTIVANLTNPRSHWEVSNAALLANKHVYSEKPLAMSVDEARSLVELAESRGLQISSAPCSFLSETAQTMARALRENRVGRVRAVYAEMDDGLVHRMPYRQWKGASGAPWPYVDEFEVGCTLEHAGYCVTWMAGLLGPATSVTAFASVQIPDKAVGEITAARMGPDFSCASIQFASGVVARLTCSIIAPHDHHFRVYGDKGVLWTDEVWHYRAPVYLRKYITLRRRMILNPLRVKLPLLGKRLAVPPAFGAARMDFARGLADLALAIGEGREARLSSRFSLHVNELSLAISSATGGKAYTMTTTFDELPPAMPWVEEGHS